MNSLGHVAAKRLGGLLASSLGLNRPVAKKIQYSARKRREKK
jgi:hypothetical protein